MSPKAFSKNQRAASPVVSIVIVAISIAAALAILILAAAPAGAAGVGSTTMSADAETYKVAPGETVTIKISDMPDATGLAEVNFEDADGFNADEFFTVTVTEKSLNATVKIVAADDTPLGDYLVEIVPAGNATHAVEVALTVERSPTQVLSGNAMTLGAGIVLIVVGYIAANVIKNKTAKRITKPLSILMYIGGIAAIAWVIYQLVEALI